MVMKNASVMAKELKAKNKRCRELMRIIKSGKASDAEIKEFSAIPRDIGPARGKVFDVLLAAKSK
ncbi:MAG: hypothetical protein H6R16_2944 [Proteobacteria bacterium]|nr:hypothetical protein [Pseudomonadota bacterium]